MKKKPYWIYTAFGDYNPIHGKPYSVQIYVQANSIAEARREGRSQIFHKRLFRRLKRDAVIRISS